MYRRKIIYWTLLMFIFLGCNRQKTASRIPIEMFFKNPVKTAFLISPDGKYISYLQPYQNRLNIYVQDSTGRSRRLTTETERNISSYFWVSNDKLIYMKDHSGNEGAKMYAVDTNSTFSTDFLPAGNFKVKILNNSTVINNQLLIALNMRDSSLFDAYRLDIRTCKLMLAAKNPGNITEWYADEKGLLRLAEANDGVNETLLYRASENALFTPVFTNNFKTAVTPVGFCYPDPDGACIYALSNQNRDKTALVKVNCKTHKEEQQLFSHPDVDVTEAGYSSRQMKVTFAVFENWKKQRYFLDDSVKAIFQDLEAKIPNTEVRIVSRDSAEQKIIVRTFTDKTPGAYYLYTISNKKLVKLSDINPALSADEMSEMKPVSFKSRDGLTINAYLTLPKGSKGKNLPVIVIPHGGPSARTSWGYNSEVQFLANRGYAVFQINFRGSTGYGKKFWIAGFKQWGTLIQDDITDGVHWLIENKIANPRRIAIYGSNFGGYAALSGLCFQPDLYACGISYSGMTNLFTYIKGVPPYYKPYLRMFYEMVGNPEIDADYFRAYSPVFHTDKIRVPVLIAQGAKDPRANVNETNQFVKELKKRGVPITYILKENEGHIFNSQENREEFYRKLEKFLADNMNK